MTLKRSYLLGLMLSSAFAYACDSSDDPGYSDAGSMIGVGGTISGAGGTTAGATPGASTAGTGASSLGGTSAGTQPGSTAGTLPGSTAGSTPGATLAGTRSDAGVPDGAGDAGMMSTGDGGSTVPPVTGGSCPGLPAVTDYAAKGPFDVMMKANVVSGDEGCTLYRPGASLGKDGFKHPIAVWGNGIATSPDQYQKLLGHIVSHGFVVIACNSSMPEQTCLNMCMDWLIKQNDSGDMAGKLDTSKELTIGYSWGGGASVDTAPRPNVKATVSFHGMPPRNDPWAKMKAPLLLFTSTGDSFVSADGYVLPNYNNSKVTTFYAQLQENVGHTYPCDEGSVCDTGGILLGGPATGAIKEQAPAIAWMRYWACGDENAKKYFFGSDCVLCKSPWKSMNKPAGVFK
jgi:hypothetical protein